MSTYTYKSISDLSPVDAIHSNDIILISLYSNEQVISKKASISDISNYVILPILMLELSGKYLALSAGNNNIVTGTIYSENTVAVLRYSNKTNPLRIIAGPYTDPEDDAWLPAKLELYHKYNDNDYKSSFAIHVSQLRGATNIKHTTTLRGKPNGELTWDTKNIVRSVNNKAATADGNCDILLSDIHNLNPIINDLSILLRNYQNIIDNLSILLSDNQNIINDLSTLLSNILSSVPEQPTTFTITYNSNYPSKKIKTITLSFDGDGGINIPSPMIEKVVDGNSYTFTIPNTEPIKTGYRFIGWLINGVIYKIGDNIVLDKDAIATAQWEFIIIADTFTITYHSNEPTIDTISLSFNLSGGTSDIDTLSQTSLNK